MSVDDAVKKPTVENRKTRVRKANLMLTVAIPMMIVGFVLAKFSLLGDSGGGDLGGALVFVLVQKLIGLAMAFWAFRLAARANRMKAPTLDEMLKADCRRPVLYVRSFNDDARSLEKKPKWWTHWFNPDFRPRGRYEQVVSLKMALAGPMVAIGRPGEMLPELGAARVYVSDDEWKDWVLNMHRQCSMVVMQAGASAGLLWEVERVFEHDTFKPTLLCFAPDRPKGPPPEDLYQEFRRMLSKEREIDLPRWLGESYLVWFGTPHKGELVPLGPGGGKGRAELMAPGFGGLWPMLEERFPGISYKADLVKQSQRRVGVAILVWFFGILLTIFGWVGYAIFADG